MTPKDHLVNYFGTEIPSHVNDNAEVIKKRALYNFAKATVVFFSIALATVSLVIVINQVIINHNDENTNAQRILCVKKWADAYSARTNTLLKTSQDRDKSATARDEALNDVLVAAGSASKAVVTAKYKIYLSAEAQYKKVQAAYTATQKSNPVPPTPNFNCK